MYDQSTRVYDMSQEATMYDQAQDVKDSYVGSNNIMYVYGSG
jgi:hypothetical protein